MRKDAVFFLILLLVVLLATIVLSITKNEAYQSYAIGMIGPALGLVIGYFIRERNRIVDLKKFRTDLFVLLSSALIGSFLIVILLKEDDLKAVYVIALNIAFSAMFLLRNANNFASKNGDPD